MSTRPPEEILVLDLRNPGRHNPVGCDYKTDQCQQLRRNIKETKASANNIKLTKGEAQGKYLLHPNL